MEIIFNIIHYLFWILIILIGIIIIITYDKIPSGILYIICILLYFTFFDQMIFGSDFCTTKLRYYDLNYFKAQVQKMEKEDKRLQELISRDIYNGWDNKKLYRKSERFGGFNSSASYAYIWDYGTESGGEGFPCISMRTCGHVWLNTDSGECGRLERVLKKI